MKGTSMGAFPLRRGLAAVLACGLAAAPLAGCASRGGGGNGPDHGVAASGAVEVNVRNNATQDMDVYAVSEGLPTRLGTVTAASTARFTLDPSFFPSNELRLVATPIGGNGRASSGPLVVRPGQRIDFDIAPLLHASSASVH
jgi:hypothetical protein